MAKTSIYLPEDLAEEIRRRDIATSAVCQRALREEIGRLRAADLSGMQTLTVHVGEALVPVSFTGRWLVDPVADRAAAPQRVMYFGVAYTGRGHIAVFTGDDSLESTNDLQTYDNLSQAAGDGVPAEVIRRAAEALGHDSVWLDI